MERKKGKNRKGAREKTSIERRKKGKRKIRQRGEWDSLKKLK